MKRSLIEFHYAEGVRFASNLPERETAGRDTIRMHIACVYRTAEVIRFPCGASPRGPETGFSSFIPGLSAIRKLSTNGLVGRLAKILDSLSAIRQLPDGYAKMGLKSKPLTHQRSSLQPHCAVNPTVRSSKTAWINCRLKKATPP
jgi:hypothetical protein